MSDKSRFCSKCLGVMELRSGSWECQKCGHSELALAEYYVETGSTDAEDQNSEQKPAVEKVTTFGLWLVLCGYVDPRSTYTEEQIAEKRFALEKAIYFSLWLLLSAYVCYLLVTTLYFQDPFSVNLEMYEIIYPTIFSLALMIGIMWYTLYCESLELKRVFFILGCITALGQAVFSFMVFTNGEFMDNFAFDTGFSGIIGLLAAAVLTVAWTCWYVYILYRDIQRMQL